MKNHYYRFFQEDGKALILAFDHFLNGNGWINPANVITAAREGGMDGILTSYGTISHFRKEIGKMGVMMRMEVIGSGLNKSNPFMERPMNSPYTVEQCAKLGVDGLMTLGILGGKFDAENIQYISRIAAESAEYGLVVSAEMLPNGFSSNPEDRTIEAMNIACRVGAEIGVDIVKTEFVKPVEEFKRVVDNCYVDVLVLGGAPVNDDRAVLENARQALDAGCKGLIIGRNVWGHKNIRGMAAALNKLVHEDYTVDEALKLLD